jgi:hypothetical protein
MFVELLAATVIAMPSHHQRVSLAPVDTSSQCEEDQPCWDCATMGNMICGAGQSSPNADLTFCPADGTWSTSWHPCPPAAAVPATGRYAWDEGAYVGGYN